MTRKSVIRNGRFVDELPCSHQEDIGPTAARSVDEDTEGVLKAVRKRAARREPVMRALRVKDYRKDSK